MLPRILHGEGFFDDEPAPSARRAKLDPRSVECRQLGCKINEDGSIEHKHLDRRDGDAS